MLTDEGLEALGKVIDGHVGPDRVPGLVALVANESQVHQVVAGELGVGGPPVSADSLWRISSTTKPLTAITTLALVDEGLIDLDEPVDRLLPELADRRVLTRMDGPLADTVPAKRAITARDLLNFTFGFGMAVEMFASPQPWPAVVAYERLGTFGPPDPDAPPDQDTWMAGFSELPLLAQPGERWLYNEGAILAGILCSRAAEAPFPEVLHSRLLEPLSLGNTAFWTDQPTRLATAYRPGPHDLEVADPPGGRWSHPPRFPNPAAGLVSTAADLLEVARMLLRGGSPVLSAAAVAELSRPQVTPAQIRGAEVFLGERSWALGQAVHAGGSRAGAFGWDGGLGTSWLVDPAHDLVVIVMTQRQFADPRLPPVHRDIQDAAYAAWRP